MSALLDAAKARATPRNACLLLLALAWGVLRWCFTDLADDAFITWRYSANWLAGEGFTFNPGEQVYGTTTPAFAVFCAGGMALGFQPWTWVLGWDVVWGAGILWRIRQVLERSGQGRWFPLAGAALVLASHETLATPGMETGLFVLLLLSAATEAARPGAHPARAMAWAAAAAILRPDGIVAVLVVAAFVLGPLARRGEWKRLLLGASPLLAGAVHAALLLAAFGTIIPHTVEAKAARVASATIPISTFGDLLWEYLVDWRRAPGSAWPLSPHWAALAGAGALAAVAWKHAAARPLAVLVAAYAALFTLGRAPRFDWYLTPVAVVLRAFSVVGAAWLAGHALAFLRQQPGGERASTPMWAALLLATAIQFPQATVLAQQIGWNAGGGWVRTDLKRYGAAARWIKEATGDAAPFIGSNEIGQLGYHGGGRIYDSEGLVTPEALDGIRRGQDPLDILWDSGAPWLVAYFPTATPLAEQHWHRRCLEVGFVPVKSFWGARWGVRTIVFRRGSAKEQGSQAQRPGEV